MLKLTQSVSHYSRVVWLKPLYRQTIPNIVIRVTRVGDCSAADSITSNVAPRLFLSLSLSRIPTPV